MIQSSGFGLDLYFNYLDITKVDFIVILFSNRVLPHSVDTNNMLF